MPNFEDYQKLLNSKPENKRYYECIILSHSLLSKTYNLVRNSKELTASFNGIDTLFLPASMAMAKPINSNDLDQIASFTLVDVNNELDDELDRIPLDDNEKILCTYLLYTTDYLSNPAENITFYVDKIAQKKGVFTISSSVTDLNKSLTGSTFNLKDFPSLRAI